MTHLPQHLIEQIKFYVPCPLSISEVPSETTFAVPLRFFAAEVLATGLSASLRFRSMMRLEEVGGGLELDVSDGEQQS